MKLPINLLGLLPLGAVGGALLLLPTPGNAAQTVEALPPVIRPQLSLELGAGAVFVTAHPQVRLGLLGDVFPWDWARGEAQLLYALGGNNFGHLSHTLGLSGRILFDLPWLADWEQAPYVRLGMQTALTAESETRSLLAGSLGLGMEGQIYSPLRYSAGVELLIPDVYSRSPFVFRPELSLRWVF